MIIRSMTAEDLASAADFTAAEGWSSETPATFESFFAHDASGCFVAEDDGDPAGICVATPYGESGFIGELIVRPDLRNQGAGRRLLEHAMAYLTNQGIEEIHLDAVTRAVPLYERMGYRRVCRSLRYTGSPAPANPPGVRRMTADDLPRVLALDREAFGDDRSFFLHHWLAATPQLCLVLDYGRGVESFLIGRQGHDSLAAGPWVVCPGADDPGRMLAALSAAGGGRTIGLGILETCEQAVAAVESIGLRSHPDPPWRMVTGRDHRLGGSPWSWAVGSAATG